MSFIRNGNCFGTKLGISSNFRFIYGNQSSEIFKQFLFGGDEMDSKLLESVYEAYEKKDEEAEHGDEGINFY